ncbi:hypothetical protein [Acinetobacter seifertii]|uniref:hypothetical protein n=1 Tax=Acinetobacter seifertii TaxID=1530123 RepID=UPI000C1DFDBB|nr:hypothetical protein [Acinetobacter seifertii]PJF05469.1 hypothetical protein CVD06_01925 [Acinetobacter seifertii]PJG68642.1 hypothetical protein CVD08_18900 [Acinetobacter seifertii]
MLRGNKLDELIEQELQIMVVEGFEKSPISHKLLHERLKQKNFISGGLSTLSTFKRKNLINRYISEQIAPLKLNNKEKQLYINKKTREALTKSNKNLRKQVEFSEAQLSQNTEILIRIINEVRNHTDLQIDHFLAPHLLKKKLFGE